MKANELMTGNLLSHKDLGVFEIHGISPHCGDYKIETQNRWVYLKNCNPILLTEECLLKFGFKKTNESKDVEWYNLNGFEIAIHEEDGQVYFVYQHMVLRHIKYVHQLQNLYFALTNKEL